VPWGQASVSKTANADAPKTIPPAREYTNPNALKLKKQDWRGDVDWTITYDTGGGRSNIIQPYYMVKDENTVKAAYNAIKDRISKGLSFDDLLPQSQYGKNWSKGAYEIKPGDPKYKAQST
jgi:hypothetical protein